jgi:hypothetical protein
MESSIGFLVAAGAEDVVPEPLVDRADVGVREPAGQVDGAHDGEGHVVHAPEDEVAGGLADHDNRRVQVAERPRPKPLPRQFPPGQPGDEAPGITQPSHIRFATSPRRWQARRRAISGWSPHRRSRRMSACLLTHGVSARTAA